jgi:hypothetical protein
MRRFALTMCVCVIFGLELSHAQAPASQRRRSTTERTDAATRLPVRRIVLYKNGIGYFEHLGRVRGSEDITIDFNSAQLDDVLTSLTALDLGDGRIGGISYNSDAPVGQRFNALRLQLGEHATLADPWLVVSEAASRPRRRRSSIARRSPAGCRTSRCLPRDAT